MLAAVFAYLITVGIFSLFIPEDRYEKPASVLLFLLLLPLTAAFWAYPSFFNEASLVYPWIQDKYYHLNFSLSYSPVLGAFFLICGTLSLFNIFSVTEERRAELSQIIFFNLAALMVLCSASTLPQIAVGSCFITFCALFSIDDAEFKKKFALYHIVADMLLILTCLVLRGQIPIPEISAVFQLKNIANYNLLAAAFILSISIKTGFFLFHNGLSDVYKVKYFRQIFISYCTTPAAGIIILQKLGGLFAFAPWTLTVFHLLIIASVLWGVRGLLFMDNIRQKSFYLNQMFFAFVAWVSVAKPDVDLLALLLGGFFLNSILLNIFISASQEARVSLMGGFIKHTKSSFLFALFMIFGAMTLIIASSCSKDIWFFMFFFILLFASMAHVLHCIYFGANQSDERVLANLRNPRFIYFIPALFAACLIYKTGFFHLMLVLQCFAAFCVLLYIHFSLPSLKTGTDSFADFAYGLILVAPVNFLGRILNLTIDFLFIEKTLLNSLTRLNDFLSETAGRFNNNSWQTYAGFVIIGMVTIFLIIKGAGL